MTLLLQYKPREDGTVVILYISEPDNGTREEQRLRGIVIIILYNISVV